MNNSDKTPRSRSKIVITCRNTGTILNTTNQDFPAVRLFFYKLIIYFLEA